MKTKRTIIQNRHGMHLRVAAEVAAAVRKFHVNVTICKGCVKADGCSVLQLLMLDAPQGSEVEITVDGENECTAIEALMGLFNDGGGI